MGDAVKWTWAQFVAEVKTFLTVDADRAGSETLVDSLILQAVQNLQQNDEYYRIGHELAVTGANSTVLGEVSVFDLPVRALIRDLHYRWITPTGARPWERRLDYYRWSQRDHLRNGIVEDVSRFWYSLDPRGETAWVYPAIKTGFQVRLRWDGARESFVDTDLVPFDRDAALVVADYVSACVRRKVNNDLKLYESFMSSFLSGRRRLFVDNRARLMSLYLAREQMEEGQWVPADATCGSRRTCGCFGSSGSSGDELQTQHGVFNEMWFWNSDESAFSRVTLVGASDEQLHFEVMEQSAPPENVPRVFGDVWLFNPGTNRFHAARVGSSGGLEIQNPSTAAPPEGCCLYLFWWLRNQTTQLFHRVELAGATDLETHFRVIGPGVSAIPQP